MRRGSSDILSRGHRGRNRLEARAQERSEVAAMPDRFGGARVAHSAGHNTGGYGHRAATIDLTGLVDVTNNGNANSPTVVIDPYDSQKLFAVWGVDLSQDGPCTYSNDGDRARGLTLITAEQHGSVSAIRSRIRSSTSPRSTPPRRLPIPR